MNKWQWGRWCWLMFLCVCCVDCVFRWIPRWNIEISNKKQRHYWCNFFVGWLLLLFFFLLYSLVVRRYPKRAVFLTSLLFSGFYWKRSGTRKVWWKENLIIQVLGQMNCEERLIRHGLFLGKGSTKGGPHRVLGDPERNVLMSVSSLR